MKRTKMLCAITSVLMAVLPVAMSVSVPIGALDTLTTLNNNKIDDVTMQMLSSMMDSERLKVWIWFDDIDEKEIQEKTETICGFTREDTRSKTTKLSADLVTFLNKDHAEYDEAELAKVKDDLKTLVKSNLGTQKENDMFRTYTATYRSTAKELYKTHNATFINKAGLNNNLNIEFVSTLTPSLIASLTKKEILELAKNNAVINIGYVDENDPEPPDCTKQMATMNVDDTISTFGVSGNGINILMIDHDFVRPELDNYLLIPNTDRIRNVYNEAVYYTNNTSDLPTAAYDHANATVAVLQEYAQDASIYTVYLTQYGDIEWAITNCDIDLIDCSANYATPVDYYSCSKSKWFDALVTKYDMPIIASAGNGMSWNDGINAPYVISPATAFNTIAVGAYGTNGTSTSDRMHNFRYNSANNTNVVQNKPDLVVASSSTSYAAPALSGITALILQLNGNLKGEPEAIKAILMASCHRKVLPASGTGDTQESMFDGLTLKQGAGAVDAYRAMCIALLGNYRTGWITNGNINGEAIHLNDNKNINVSLVWSINNVMKSSPNAQNPVDVGTKQDLELRIYRGSTLTAVSNKMNTGKQLAYFTGTKNLQYTVQVTKAIQNTEFVYFAYAWSTASHKELETVQITGNLAKGQTLSAVANCTDATVPNITSLQYQWKSSADGEIWTNIIGATSSTYTLTNSEFLKYIRCEVTPTEGAGIVPFTVYDNTDTRVVIYGDVNLNGTVTASDATEIQKYAAGLVDLTLEQLMAADVNGDGLVNSNDATLIQKYVASLITVFPVEE